MLTAFFQEKVNGLLHQGYRDFILRYLGITIVYLAFKNKIMWIDRYEPPPEIQRYEQFEINT